MNSKEALEYVKMCCSDGLQLPQNQSVEQVLLIGDSLATIEKELEILEILKKKMTIETDYYDSDIGCEEYEYIAYNGEPLIIVDKDEFNKIKEWLENDKSI